MSESIPTDFDHLNIKSTISLTSFYQSGKAVAIPVEALKYNDKLYVSTWQNSYKVKRIANTPNIKVAPCTMRGKLTGPIMDARARIVPQDEGGDAQEVF